MHAHFTSCGYYHDSIYIACTDFVTNVTIDALILFRFASVYK